MIDLNCDLGEMPETQWRDIEILSLVSSCNIACGGHAGDSDSMTEMVRHAAINNVRIGAHPSYPDKENFGRKSMIIDHDILRQSLSDQIYALREIAHHQGHIISYVKPHGALYNDAADDEKLAQMIIDLIHNIDPQYAVMGLARSQIEYAAARKGMKFIAEAFIDRRYTPSARLLNRNKAGAIISDIIEQKQQAMALINGDNIMTSDGSPIKIKANSLCMHSDSDGALSNARQIRQMLADNDVIMAAL